MASLEGKTVLIVDDSEYLRERLKSIFAEAGMTITGMAESGIDAVREFQKVKPDLVTLDIIMPRMGGLEALKKIVEIDGDATVIMISSLGTEENVIEAIESGARNFILKPFEKDAVLEIVTNVLGG